MASSSRFKTITVTDTASSVSELPDVVSAVTPEMLWTGNFKFTVVNPSGVSFVYKVKKIKGVYQGKETDNFYLSVKATGGQYPFRYVGVVLEDGTLKPTGKSNFLKGTLEYDVAAWALDRIIHHEPIPAGYQISPIKWMP